VRINERHHKSTLYHEILVSGLTNCFFMSKSRRKHTCNTCSRIVPASQLIPRRKRNASKRPSITKRYFHEVLSCPRTAKITLQGPMHSSSRTKLSAIEWLPPSFTLPSITPNPLAQLHHRRMRNMAAPSTAQIFTWRCRQQNVLPRDE
jgi:hypothetical protein